MTMEYQPLIQFALQLPIVGVFMWFTLEMMKREQVERAKRDDDWRKFLSEQREATNTGLARLAEEIKENGKLVTTTNALLINHDANVKTISAILQAAIEKSQA